MRRARPPQADEVVALGHLARDLAVVGLPRDPTGRSCRRTGCRAAAPSGSPAPWSGRSVRRSSRPSRGGLVVVAGATAGGGSSPWAWRPPASIGSAGGGVVLMDAWMLLRRPGEAMPGKMFKARRQGRQGRIRTMDNPELLASWRFIFRPRARGPRPRPCCRFGDSCGPASPTSMPAAPPAWSTSAPSPRPRARRSPALPCG